MNIGNLIAGACVVAVCIPWLLTSLSRGHINLNGLALDFAETITEIVTRQETNFSGQDQPPSQNQEGL